MKRVTLPLLLVILLICCVDILRAQDDSNPKRGFYPGGSYAVSEIETINRTDGNLILNVPLASLPAGRGGMSATLNLTYNNKLWDSLTNSFTDDQLHYTEHILVPGETAGWRYGFQYSWTDKESPAESCAVNGYLHQVQVTFPDGSQHEFRPYGYQDKSGYFRIGPDGWIESENGDCSSQGSATLATTSTMTYYSTDGTYLRLDIAHDSDRNLLNNPWTLSLPDGERVVGMPDSAGNMTSERIYDRNSNYINIVNTSSIPSRTEISDQFGRSIIIDYAAIIDNLTRTDYITMQGFNNEPLRWSVHYKKIKVNKTYLNCTGVNCPVNDSADLNEVLTVVDLVTLPSQVSGLSYSFGYNVPDYDGTPNATPTFGWGEVSSVTIPSGASAAYHYKHDGIDGILWSSALHGNFPTSKNLTHQLEYDGMSTPTTETWLYAFKPNAQYNSQITAPDGGVQRDYWYSGIPSSSEKWRTNLIYKSEHPDGSLTERLWLDNTPSGTGSYNYSGILQKMNVFVKTDFKSIRDSLGNLTKTAITDYSYDKNGNLTSVSQYDWVLYSDVPRDAAGMPTGIPGTAVIKKVVTNNFYNSTPPAADITTDNPYAYSKPGSPNKRNSIASTEIGNGVAALTRTEFTYDNPSSTGNLTQSTAWDSTKGPLNSSPPYLTTANSISLSSEYVNWSTGENGKLVKTTDARGTQTWISYGSVGGFDLYPTQIITAYGTTVQRTATRDYDFWTGLVNRVTDADNNVSTSTMYDAVGRPTLVKAAEGKPEETRTVMEYSDPARRVVTRSDLNTLGDGKLVSIQHYDQLGRVRLSRQLEDSSVQSATDETTGIKVQSRYSFSGSNSYQAVSNPYRAALSSGAGSETSMGWSRSKSNNGGHLVEVQTFGGAALPAPWGSNSTTTGTVTTAYNAEFTSVTDQASRVRRSTIDGLGRLTRVDEPDATSGNLDDVNANPVQPTSYNYDAVGNLHVVTQGQQQRFFMYDSLSRLIRASNPEQEANANLSISDPVTNHSEWCMKYEYYENGTLLRKTDARGVLSTYAYDALNRNTGISYSNDTAGTPNVTRTYDGATNGKGRLSQTETSGPAGSRTTINSFDSLGRPTKQGQQFYSGGTWSAAYSMAATYDRAGHVLSQTYPSGHTVNYAYDSAGRNSSFIGNLGEGVLRTYADEFQYTASGSLQQERFGTDTPLYHKQRFNQRGQLWDMRLSTASFATDPADGDRGAIVNYYSDNFVQGGSNANNNGNLLRQEIYIPGSNFFQQNYSYDSLNRLKSVAEKLNDSGNDTFKQAYTFDRWGNRTIDQANTTANVPHPAFTVNPANNRLSAPAGYYLSYDTAGNQTEDSTNQNFAAAIYDAENRLKEVSLGPTCYPDGEGGQICQAPDQVPSEYVYDGLGQRVRRLLGGPLAQYETWQVYGFDGELLAEYPQQGPAVVGQPQTEYGYRQGQLLVKAEPWTNVALNKPATQIDNYSQSSTAQKAVNGDANGVLASGATSATNSHANSWWQVDLQSVQTIASITVWGRTDCCPETTSDFYVFVSNNAFTSADLNTTINQSGVSNYYHSGFAGPSATTGLTSINVNRTGRYVRVQLAGTQSLALAEVQVWSAAAKLEWLVTDHLGTPRMVVDKTGGLAGVSRHDHLPFGEEIFADTGGRSSAQGYGAADGVRQKFTQKERDIETGLDYFGARYYSSAQGRFTSVDPDNAGAYEGNPQTWNGYGYGLNNPMLYSDPDGLRVRVCDTSGNCTNGDTDLTDDQWNSWFRGDKTVIVRGGNIYKNGELIGYYQQQSCDSCLYDIHALGREIVANDPGTRALRVWGKSVIAGATLPSSAAAYIGIGVFTVVVSPAGEEQDDLLIGSTASDRQAAVREAWRLEAERARSGRPTKTPFTADQLRELRDTGRVSGYEGHHTESVEAHPEVARDPNKIKFVEGRAAHLEEHGGNWRNPTPLRLGPKPR